jgi:DNA-binding transcriptional MerR regulator
MGYRVKTVSAMTGIPRGTLLAWERRYDILEPDRSPSGYREYSDADVAVFKRMKTLVDEGYSASEAVGIIKADAAAGSSQPPEVRAALYDAGDVVEAILRALLDFDRAAADRLVPRLGQVAFTVAIDDVFLPVLDRLGQRWERGEITIAQEHYVSGFCREHLLAMYHGLAGGPAKGITVACATPPGERHELGLLVLALRLALAGHRAIWLGADLPVPDLCAYLALHQPRFVCLSFTRVVSKDTVVNFARAVRAGAPPATEIVLGGSGLAAGVGVLPEGVHVVDGFAALQQLLERAGREPRLGRPERASS